VSEAIASPPAIAPPAPVVAGSLGLLGGTFDPIHHGHLAIAEEAREALGLERVLLVPAATPPHKPGRPVTPAEDRLAMLELAIAGNPAFAVSRVELDRGGRSYTADTLEALRAQRGTGAAEPWFILSAEALAEFPTWRRPDRILELCRLAVVPRAGHERLDVAWVTANLPGRESRVRFLPGPLLPISGSVVRRRAAAGRSVRYLVPDAVARYIAEHRLYTEPAWRTQTT
jgi:nicotinate-nucleotide adenylyltransferase